MVRWQRAKFLPHPELLPHHVGRLVWVEARPPEVEVYRSIEDDRMLGATREERAFTTHVTVPWNPYHPQLVISTDAIELLAEFSEDVKLQTLDEWEEENRA